MGKVSKRCLRWQHQWLPSVSMTPSVYTTTVEFSVKPLPPDEKLTCEDHNVYALTGLQKSVSDRRNNRLSGAGLPVFSKITFANRSNKWSTPEADYRPPRLSLLIK